MFKKTIPYEDFDGEKREEDFYFHLSDAELLEMEMSRHGGLSAALQKLVKEKNPKEIIKTFKWIILSAHGIKSDDGRRFQKNDQIRRAFEECPAYSKLFMELATDAKASSDFINQLVTAERLAAAHTRANQPTLPTPAPEYSQPQFDQAVDQVTDGPGTGARFA